MSTSTSPEKGEALLRCEGLEVGHHGRTILPALDVIFRSGELWAVVGRNGSGKTTLFRTALGLIPPVRGTVLRAAPDLRLSYVPQRSSFDRLFPVVARDVVRMGLDRGRSFLRPSLREPEAVRAALEGVSALELSGRPFRTLSEGQKQRVLLARLAASTPQLALLDEPTAAMDVVAEREAFGLLRDLRDRQGTTVVVVSHYLSAAREFADRVIFLDREGEVALVGAPEVVFGDPAFGRRYGDAAMDDCHE